MNFSAEQIEELQELAEWYQTVSVDDGWRHRVLTYGTNSDRVSLQLFENFGAIVGGEPCASTWWKSTVIKNS